MDDKQWMTENGHCLMDDANKFGNGSPKSLR